MDFISDDKVEEFHGEGTTSKGYCHFNDNSDKKDFTISMRGHSFNLYQEPGNRTLGHGAGHCEVEYNAHFTFQMFDEQ